MRNRDSASHSRTFSPSWYPPALPTLQSNPTALGEADRSVLLTPWDRAPSTASHPWGSSSGHQCRLAKPKESLTEQSVPTPEEVAASAEFLGDVHRLCTWADMESSPASLIFCDLVKSNSKSLTFLICKMGRIIAPRPPHRVVPFVL